MKRRIVVTIDAGEKTCGKCERKQYDLWKWFCGQFGCDVSDLKRCPECLRAEKEAKPTRGNECGR
jgi:hypothetical protein